MSKGTDFWVELELGAMAVCFVGLPFLILDLTDQIFSVSVLNLVGALVIGLGLLNAMRGTVPIAWPKDKTTNLILALVALTFILALFVTNPLQNAIGFWVSRLLEPFLLGLMSVSLVASGFLRPNVIVRWLLLSLLGLFLAAAFQFLNNSFGHGPRLYLPYEFPDTLARYYAIVLTFSLSWLLIQRPGWFWWLIWSGGLIGLLGTQSFNAVATTGLGFLVVIALLPAKLHTTKRRGWLILALSFIAAMIVAPRLAKWEVTMTDSLETRKEFWQVARGALHDNYWAGIGIKGWETQYPTLVQQYSSHRPPLNWGSAQPHNIFLDGLLKAGILGLLAVLGLLFLPIISGLKLLHRANQPFGWFGLGLAAYGTAMLAFGLLDDPLWSDDTMPLLFMLTLTTAWLINVKTKTRPGQK